MTQPVSALRLTWRKQARETGLRAVGSGPRGAVLKVNGEDIGRVYARRIDVGRYSRWWWAAYGKDFPRHVDPDVTYETLEEAKAACEAHVRKVLGLPARRVK